AASFEGGVYKFNQQADEFIFMTVNNAGIISSDYDTRSFFNDVVNDCMWIGTAKKGLVRYDYKTRKWTEFQTYDSNESLYEINAISQFSSNELALGTERGLYSFNLISQKLVKQANIQSIFSLVQDREEGVWVGTYYDGV